MSSAPRTDAAAAIRTERAERSRAALAGIGLMLLGILLFSLNDVMGKWLVATYSVGQVLFVRSLAALVVLGLALRQEGVAALRRTPQPGLQIVRVLLVVGEVTCFYAAVAALPLADVMTYYLAGPIYVTALSAALLREAVGWRRWTAVLVGFAGVLIALRPTGASLTPPALIALAGSVLFALLMIATRKLRGASDTALVAWPVIGTLAFGALAAPLHWVPPTPRDFALLSALGVVAMAANFCVVRSLKLAPASVVVPYQYTLIVWAVVFGYAVFGDVPGPNMVLGAGLIVGAGLFIFLREQAARRAAS